MLHPSDRNPVHHLFVIAIVCFLAIVPFFWRGSPSGHDFEFHMFSWMEVLGQWKQGIVYPRWAALAHWGYGEARFLFYPPASWLLGAALGSLLPWHVVPAAYCSLVLTLAGCSMYRLAREWLPARDALFAAALYAVNPYHLIIVYWRSAFAELLAAALLPMLLLRVLRLKEPGLRPVSWLGLILATSWLVNAPAAIMIYYSTAAFIFAIAVLQRSGRPLLRGAIAVLLGLCITSFYLIPTICETQWISINQVLAPGLRPPDNFLFATTPDPEHNQFNLFVSWIATAEIVVLALAIWRTRMWRLREREPWLLLVLWGAGAALVMISISNPLWQHLPKLHFMQLPWRWLLCLNVALALLLTMALPRWAARAFAVAALFAAVLVAGYRIQPPWWDDAADIAEMNDAIATRAGYEGTDEYVPRGADPYELNKDTPQVSGTAGTNARTKISEWLPTEKHFIIETDRPELLTLRLFNYPAWQATVNGTRVTTQTTEVTGQMAIQIMPGTSDIRIHFGRTRDRTIGAVVSLLTMAALALVWMKTRSTP
jgi:uncharacterized membrane protein